MRLFKICVMFIESMCMCNKGCKMVHLAYVPDQVGSMAELPEEAVAPSPACLSVQAHEAGVLLAEVAGPEAVHNAAARELVFG